MFFVRAGVQKNREKIKKQNAAEAQKAAMARAQSLRSEGISRQFGSFRQASFGQAGHADYDPGPNTGYTVRIKKVEDSNLRILSCVHKDVEAKWHFFCPSEEQLSLFFLRSIFTSLRKQLSASKLLKDDVAPKQNVDDNIPVAAFQRAFERLFYVLGDEEGFQATDYDANNNGCVGWGEFSYLYNKRYIGIRWSICERIYRTLDDPESSILAQLVSIFVLLTITVSSLTFIFSTVPDMKDQKDTFAIIEDVCLIIFTIEYCLRLCTVWAVRLEVLDNKRLMDLACGYEKIVLSSPLWRVIYFLIAPANLIDLAAILPGIVSWFVELEGGGFVVLRLIRLTRIFRAFKNPKLQEPVIVIAQTLVNSTKALYVLAFNLGLGIVIFGSLMYLAESGDDGEERGWKSIPHSLWVALVTSTTVGYGDMFPETSLGYVVTTVCMVSSLAILALPVGVIGGNFDKVWQDFHKAQTQTNKEIEQDRNFLVNAIQTVNPREMSRLLLIEVWNERLPNLAIEKRVEGVHFRPHSGEFLGQVTIKTELPPDQPFASGPITLKLKPNYDIVKRDVTGSITVEYEWLPSDLLTGSTSPPGPPAEPFSPTDPGSLENAPDLVGLFRVTLLSAENLLNVVFLRHPPMSCSPYCIVFCYPKSPVNRGVKHHPSAWRSPTCKNSKNPVWEVDHAWNFSWTNIAPTPRGEHRRASLLAMVPPALRESIARLSPIVQLEILNALRCFSQDMVHIKRDVARLCDRLGISVSSDRENVKGLPWENEKGYSPEPRTDEAAAQAATGSSTFAAAHGDTASSAAPSPEPYESSPSALLEGLLQPAPGASG